MAKAVHSEVAIEIANLCAFPVAARSRPGTTTTSRPASQVPGFALLDVVGRETGPHVLADLLPAPKSNSQEKGPTEPRSVGPRRREAGCVPSA